ncbi:MAG: hypothetical protein GKR92_01565 [Gammaproteobacteria bacterium]|nr:MAG: hypothetical protein GKR92_01565 [Gammaproteobacteria bacterium]
MTLLFILAITIGIRHAFEPDHMAAVLSVSTQSNSLSATAKQGAIWGVGHTITLFIFSMILMGLNIEIDRNIFVLFEFIIGLVLIWMGFDVVNKSKVLLHDRGSNHIESEITENNNKTKLSLKSLGIGLLHGAAGSGVIIALITTTIDSIYLKFAYIALFSFGLIISMSLLSILMTMPMHRNFKIIPLRYFKVITGTLAILIGMKILYQSSAQISTLLT